MAKELDRENYRGKETIKQRFVEWRRRVHNY
jgi:hypothetical protein